MPTGYTADIEKGISFKEFALKCARGMGACVMQRDDDMRAPIKMDEPSDYNANQLKKSKIELEKFESSTDIELEKVFQLEQKDRLDDIKKDIKKKKELRRKYLDMFDQVENWKSPSKDHDNFKQFMKTQILESIDFDCNLKYYQDELNSIEKISFKIWKGMKLARLKHDIDYHTKENQKEIDRCNERNTWKKQLIESLNV